MSTQQIESLPLADFTVDISLSGRTAKEIETNASELAIIMAAAGGWSAAHPGLYFVRDGRKHLVAGFTRMAAALKNKWTAGAFVEVEDSPITHLLTAIRSNTGKPISAVKQGEIYAKLRDGSEGVEPMDIKEIAKTVGKSFVWITSAIGIYESTPEIGKLIEQDKISPNVAIRAKQLVKDDKKRFQMLEDAVAEAVIEGKTRASESHLDAVKHKYLPKPKAAEEPKPSKPVENAPQSPVIDLKTPSLANALDGASGSGIEVKPELINDLPLENVPAPVAKTANKLLPAFRKCIEEFTNDADPQIDINDGQIHQLCQRLIAVVVADQTPF